MGFPVWVLGLAVLAYVGLLAVAVIVAVSTDDERRGRIALAVLTLLLIPLVRLRREGPPESDSDKSDDPRRTLS